MSLKDTLKINFTLTKDEFTKGVFAKLWKYILLIGIIVVLSQAIPSSFDDYNRNLPNWLSKLFLLHLPGYV